MRYLAAITFLSPALAVYHSVRNLPWSQKKGILVVSIALFGATIILKTSDGYVLQQLIYEHYIGLSFDRWLFELKEMLVFSPEAGTKGDVFSHVSSYLIGEILGIPGQYFFFISLIYGIAYVSAMSKILRWSSEVDKSIIFWCLIITFISYRFIDNLQTVRTWTGLWVLFNGVLGYYQTGRKRFVLLMLCAPLFHVAYFVIAIPAFIAIACRWIDLRIFIIGYVLSFFLQVDASSVVKQLESTELGEQKVAGYYKENPEDYRDPLEEKSSNWYKKYGKGWSLTNAPHFLAAAIILFGLFSRREMTMLEVGLFSTGLTMAILANLGDFVPAFYNRTMINAGIYILACAVLLFLRDKLLYGSGTKLQVKKMLISICLLLFLPYVIYVAANMLQFTSVFMFAFPIFGMVDDINMSVREFLGFAF